MPLKASLRNSKARPMRLICKLLTLIAVLLMPFGMTPASAVQSKHHEMAGMAMNHCPGDQSQPDTKQGIAACTMVCSAALPAVADPGPQLTTIVCAPELASPTRQLIGLHPETADPPPKRS